MYELYNRGVSEVVTDDDDRYNRKNLTPNITKKSYDRSGRGLLRPVFFMDKLFDKKETIKKE